MVEGQPYIAMQFIAGSSLEKLRAEMTMQDKVFVVQQVAEALHAAHVRGVIHRDIKPDKIRLLSPRR